MKTTLPRGGLVLALFLGATLTRPCRAAESAPAELSLARALELAREASPDVLAARNAVSQADSLREQARQLPNPSLSLSVGKINTDGRPASTDLGNGFFDRNYDTIVAGTQLLEIGGKRKARRASAEAGLAAAGAHASGTTILTEVAVARAYAAALLSGDAAAGARSSADALRKSAEIAAAREAAGDASAAERAQIEIAAGRFAADALGAEASARSALYALETLLGLPADSSLRLTDTLAPLADRASSLPAADADDAALARRPDVVEAEAAFRRARAELDLARAIRVPDPTLLVQYERQPPDQPNTVGFGVSLPLPLWHRNAAGVRLADAQLEAAQLARDRAVAQARAELADTRSTLAAARERARLHASELLPRAEKVRETVAFAYGEGAASLLELLEAERNVNDVRLAAASARADLVAAWASFLAARGLSLGSEVSR